MKINYQNTLNTAKDQALIQEGDKYVFCTIRPKEGKRSGSFVEIIYYKYNILLVVNKDEVKLIDIDQKTGELVGSYKIINRDNIIEFNDFWCFFSRDFYLEAQNPYYRENFAVTKKFNGYDQKEMFNEIRNFIKQEYTTIKEAKKKK